MARSSFSDHPARWIVGAFSVLVLAPVLAAIATYAWVHNSNNAAAQQLEHGLLALEVPAGAEVVDSSWLVSRFAPAGNGTQYAGVLLVRSDLTQEALGAAYEAQPGSPRVAAADDDSVARLAGQLDSGEDLHQPGTYLVVDLDEPTSTLLSSVDLRGH
ncbi:hypothetical protein [Leucobacter luti]|uniref:Uncharacterized protein n=1 Tax=Leucobacter luti TaxID=340320 RepID=A0A4Q7TUZ9_9MICO|nr:hypothetical protein [Leucobacter luti]MBL3698150.1 hypothetical protein [Leucobacter luti]RZT64766.1 hypothetical protein EV139_2190 [Leucobacter luti]